MAGFKTKVTPEIENLTEVCKEHTSLDLSLYAKYDVKRGLRDINGKGVLAGLTQVSNVKATKIVDGKEVQRCWHLGVENVKHHRFEHQDKGDKHFIAPGFIQLECLTKEDDGDDDGENNQHQIGDFYVVHQPCTYEDHHHAAK